MAPPTPEERERHLSLARESLRELVEDPRVPSEVRRELATDYRQVEGMLQRLEQGEVHIAAFGRVSVGKSALLNALLGEKRFSTSPLHGETKDAHRAQWREYHGDGVQLIDTPGIDELDGETRERLAHEVAGLSDLVIFVVDGDITATELKALKRLSEEHRPLVLAMNKADRYGPQERDLLLETLETKTDGLIPFGHIVPCAALPSPRTIIRLDAAGQEHEQTQTPPPAVDDLKQILWEILDTDGKTLAAINAGLFAGRLSDRITRRIMATRRQMADQVVRSYCLGKGMAVALNPVPVADLLAVAADAAMVVHLSRVYGMPMTRAEAGKLIRTIATQITVLMGTVWTVQLVSSALKGVSFGLSTIVTASAQGAVAYYGTYIVGKAAESYFAHGQAWGEGGPKRAVREIPAALDPVLDRIDVALDKVPEKVEARSEQIETLATKTVLGFVERLDVYSMIVENARGFDEAQLENLLKLEIICRTPVAFLFREYYTELRKEIRRMEEDRQKESPKGFKPGSYE